MTILKFSEFIFVEKNCFVSQKYPLASALLVSICGVAQVTFCTRIRLS